MSAVDFLCLPLARVGNVLTGLTGCLVWLPLIVWTVLIIGWMITAEIDIVVGILALLMVLAMGVLAFNSPTPILPPLLFVAGLGTLVMLPVARLAMNKAELKSFEQESMERAYELLGTNPRNIGGKLRMARALYNHGHAALAAEVAEKALQGMSETTFREEWKNVREWRAAAPGPAPATIRCVHCGYQNASEQMFCQGCGERYLLAYVQGRTVAPGLKGKLIAGWFAAMLAMVGIPVAATTLAPALALVAILLLLGGAVAILYFAFRRMEASG